MTPAPTTPPAPKPIRRITDFPMASAVCANPGTCPVCRATGKEALTREQAEALTDEQLIEKMAVEVMGWRKVDKPGYARSWIHGKSKALSSFGQELGWDDDGCCDVVWNPLTDWNHTMEVAVAATARDLNAFVRTLGSLGYSGIEDLMYFPKPRRICLAALLAISS